MASLIASSGVLPGVKNNTIFVAALSNFLTTICEVDSVYFRNLIEKSRFWNNVHANYEKYVNELKNIYIVVKLQHKQWYFTTT